jgi:hypothetical protein
MYSGGMPRTKPAISRPLVRQSIIAYSSATRTGWLRSGRIFPSTPILIFLVFWLSADAIRFGDGIVP